MSNAVRRGRKSGSRKVGVRSNLRGESVKHMFTGIAPRGRFDPPRIILSPWNSVIVNALYIGVENESTLCINGFTLGGLLRKQFALPSTVNFSFRIQRVDIWHRLPNGEINNKVRVRFYSLALGPTDCDTSSVLTTLEDEGTPTRPAHVHFLWPRSQSTFVVSSIDKHTFMQFVLSSSQNVLVHFHLLYKYPDAVPLTVCNGHIQGQKSVFVEDVLRDDFEKLNI